MNEVIQRIKTAIICAVVTLVMTGYNIYMLSVYYLLLTIMCLYEYHYQIDSTRKKITIGMSLIIYIIANGYIIGLVERKYLSLILPIIMSLFSIELFSGKPKPMLSIGTDLIGIVWICIPMLIAVLLSWPIDENGTHYNDPRIVYGIMIFVFVNDAGAYFVGKLIGQTKLFPSVSPKKTWEGAIGGGVISILFYYPVKTYINVDGISDTDWFVIGTISIVCGIIGDLIESMFKRDLKIKDTGTILQKHGGILDRGDAMLYVIPFVYSYLTVVGNVTI